MSEIIFRSGVPHAVETNLVTRNAVNPRHAFSDNDPATHDVPPDGQDPATHSAKQSLDADAPVVAGDHFTDNLQALEKANYTDNVQALDKTNVTDNWQSLGKAHVQDNLQDVDTDAFHDNRQSLGNSQSIQEQKLYLEKKSIKDNRQKVTSNLVPRAAPQLPDPVGTPTTVPGGAPQPAVHASAVNAQNAPVASTLKVAEDDELRARMKKLKATVRDVSHTLSDLAHKPDEPS